MNNFPLGSPEHKALERLKSMRLISGDGRMDHQATELIEEVALMFKEHYDEVIADIEEGIDGAIEDALAAQERLVQDTLDKAKERFMVMADSYFDGLAASFFPDKEPPPQPPEPPPAPVAVIPTPKGPRPPLSALMQEVGRER